MRSAKLFYTLVQMKFMSFGLNSDSILYIFFEPLCVLKFSTKFFWFKKSWMDRELIKLFSLEKEELGFSEFILENKSLSYLRDGCFELFLKKPYLLSDIVILFFKV